MKKIILILFLLCLLFCGCNKDISQTPELLTDTPQEENALTIKAKCDVCGDNTECEKYEYKTKTFYVCEYCIKDVKDSISDIETYDSLVEAARVSVTYEDTLNDLIPTTILGDTKRTEKGLLIILDANGTKIKRIATLMDGSKDEYLINPVKETPLDTHLKEILGDDYSEKTKCIYRKAETYMIRVDSNGDINTICLPIDLLNRNFDYEKNESIKEFKELELSMKDILESSRID